MTEDGSHESSERAHTYGSVRSHVATLASAVFIRLPWRLVAAAEFNLLAR